MNTQDVIEFFDRLAPTWDAEMIPKDRIIGHILDNANINQDMDVLDVACGTGVLFPHYMQRGVNSVTGIDISSEMVRIATEKFAEESRIRLICGDVEETSFDCKFDVVVVYNAFPHFPDPARLIANLCKLLKDDGCLTIAHSMSREQIDNHHKGSANKVSNGLMTAGDLKKLFDPWLDVNVMISNHEMYQLCGIKKPSVRAEAHSHSHENGHIHSHPHDHAHTHASNGDMAETRTLLEYMLHHNEHHAEELADMMDSLKWRVEIGFASFKNCEAYDVCPRILHCV